MMIAGGEVGISYLEAKFDWISLGDIGRVCGTLLVGGPPAADANGKNVIRLYGPEEMSQNEALGVIGKVLGKELAVNELGENEGVEQFMTCSGLPEPAARHYIGILRGRAEQRDGLFNDDAIGNIEKYSGKKPTKFGEWVAENKMDFEV
jgi:uncharacterized protein YbjT (DUF2867 family)